VSTLGDPFECRVASGCTACCTVWAIPEPYANHPNGKAAGEPCQNLTAEAGCSIYLTRPQACRDFTPSLTLCGEDAAEATNLQMLLRDIMHGSVNSLLLTRARG
jgi:hypothetical protein